jgi:hypothetical protein
MDSADLETLREQSGLRLDREGNFFHRGEPIEHARTLAVLHQGLHRAPDGRWATRIGREWGYLEVEDAALWIRRIEANGARLRAQLAGGDWVDVDPATLALGRDDALYVRLTTPSLRGERARLTRAAQLSLAEAIREEGGAFFLELAGARVPIGRDAGPEPLRPGS